MPRLSQTELQENVSILATNGQLSEAQEVIARVGYNNVKLETLAALLQAWQDYKLQARVKLVAQKKATQAAAEARAATSGEINSFSETARILFGDDDPTMTVLGLRPLPGYHTGAKETNADAVKQAETTLTENGAKQPKKRKRARASQSRTSTLSRWGKLLAGIESLSPEQKARLAEAGWPPERVTRAACLVQAYFEAEIAKMRAVAAYDAQMNQAQEVEAVLRKNTAGRLGYAGWLSRRPTRRISSSFWSFWGCRRDNQASPLSLCDISLSAG